jgi:hypothetical protein
MQKWEYERGYDLSIDDLQALGGAGWELVAVRNTSDGCAVFYFKRPVPVVEGHMHGGYISTPLVR